MRGAVIIVIVIGNDVAVTIIHNNTQLLLIILCRERTAATAQSVERHRTLHAIGRAHRQTFDCSESIGIYSHSHGWSNRDNDNDTNRDDKMMIRTMKPQSY